MALRVCLNAALWRDSKCIPRHWARQGMQYRSFQICSEHLKATPRYPAGWRPFSRFIRVNAENLFILPVEISKSTSLRRSCLQRRLSWGKVKMSTQYENKVAKCCSVSLSLFPMLVGLLAGRDAWCNSSGIETPFHEGQTSCCGGGLHIFVGSFENNCNLLIFPPLCPPTHLDFGRPSNCLQIFQSDKPIYWKLYLIYFMSLLSISILRITSCILWNNNVIQVYYYVIL